MRNRDIGEVQIDITELINKLAENQEKIDKVEYAVDSRVTLVSNGSVCKFDQSMGGINFKTLFFNN